MVDNMDMILGCLRERLDGRTLASKRRNTCHANPIRTPWQRSGNKRDASYISWLAEDAMQNDEEEIRIEERKGRGHTLCST
jgi:hypothetical protein